MASHVIETRYPIIFRKHEAQALGKHLQNRHSVMLIGMKRVGISNFLRFFLNHKDTQATYINDRKKHLFVPIELNDLVETELFPFWILTLKRIQDAVGSSTLSAQIKDSIEKLFIDSIQSKELFLTIDAIQKSLLQIIEADMLPTLFFNRFDRIVNAATTEFFNNLNGLKDATHRKAAFVFTSFRGLDMLAPDVFPRPALSVFAQNMSVKPATESDMEHVLSLFKSLYKLSINQSIEKSLFETTGGHIQYLQFALIHLHERKTVYPSELALFNELLNDERVMLQSEELWESLTSDEQTILLRVQRDEKITEKEKEVGKYLWETGFVRERGKKQKIFSPLFEHYVRIKQLDGLETALIEFSKKEHLLFTLLKTHINEICEREKIIASVWPEAEELGVSDWAIDRLVARVRQKLKLQKSQFEVQTIKTRGYKLIENISEKALGNKSV